MKPVTPDDIQRFRATVWAHYRQNGRDLPWRHTRDPYRILVSEVMLQQTQVPRVIPKYAAFLSRFPTVAALAEAPTADVLALWQGLGYNRRALALHRAAQTMVAEHGGAVPRTATELQRLPGVGAATAAAVCVYAYATTLPFIETNIRSAFIDFFFQECSRVSDAELLPLVELALDCDNPRDWYYALMDYGTWIKKDRPNPSRKSKHYVTQSRFAGSRREARAAIIRVLLAERSRLLDPVEIGQTEPAFTARDNMDLRGILEELTAEGFLVREDGRFRVA